MHLFLTRHVKHTPPPPSPQPSSNMALNDWSRFWIEPSQHQQAQSKKYSNLDLLFDKCWRPNLEQLPILQTGFFDFDFDDTRFRSFQS